MKRKSTFSIALLLFLLPVFLAAQTPVFYLTFDHMDDDNFELYDLVNGLIGTASGEITSSGYYGDGYALNGTDGYIHFSDVVINRGSFSLTTWFSVLSFDGEDPALFQTDGPEEGGAIFILMYEDGMECFANTTSGENAVWAEVAPPLEDWMHLAMVVDTESGMVSIYADGEEVGSAEGSFPDEADKPLIGPFSIGAHSMDGESFDRNWTGIVDDFRLYDVALTAEEVVTSMEELEGVGVESLESEPIAVFPNPSSGTISLSKDVETIRIYTTSGRELFLMNNCKAFSRIDVSDLNKGMYILKTESKEGSYTSKLVLH